MTPELTQEQQGVETTPSPSPESRSTPGTLIRRARERARITSEELAATMKLARGTLEALERDDFKVLMEPVYVRGYYRKCAKVLGIAEKDLVDAYESIVAPRTPEAPAKLRLASGSELGSGSRLPLALASGAALIGVIVISLVWFARGEVNHVPVLSEPKIDVAAPADSKAEAVPVDATAVGATDATPDATTPATAPAVATPAAPVSAVPAAAPAVTPAPAAAQPTLKPAPAISTTPATPAAQSAPTPVVTAPSAAATHPVPAGSVTGSLTLQFNITSWARVDDASGKTLVNGLVRSGEKKALIGPAPFAVFLGNAPGVDVAFNGKAVDLKKYTAQNNTARFSAGPSAQ